MKKYDQPKDVAPPSSYDGKKGMKDPYPIFNTPRPENPKTGTVRGHGKNAKPGYMSKNG